MKALVLSGGGAAGSWQTGVLKYLLLDRKEHYSVICGTSVGAINGAALSQYPIGQEEQAYELLERLWLKVSNKDVWRHRFPPYMSALWSSSLYKTDPLRKLITENLSLPHVRNSGRILRIEAASLTTGKIETWKQSDSDLIDGIMASSAFPGVFEPIRCRNQVFVDGGVRNVSPLSSAIKAGATNIDLVLSVKGGMAKQEKDWKAFGVLSRCFNIMFDEMVENDLKLCDARNKDIKFRKVRVRIVRPSVSIKGDLNFDPKIAKEQIEIGYHDGRLIQEIVGF